MLSNTGLVLHEFEATASKRLSEVFFLHFQTYSVLTRAVDTQTLNLREKIKVYVIFLILVSNYSHRKYMRSNLLSCPIHIFKYGKKIIIWFDSERESFQQINYLCTYFSYTCAATRPWLYGSTKIYTFLTE